MLTAHEINGRVGAWMKSPSGKKRVQNHVAQIVTREKADELAKELVRIVQAHIPEQIMSAGCSLSYHTQMTGDLIRQIDFRFEWAAVRRSSLFPEEYPEGITNIVALFNNGYRTNPIETVYGTWHDRKLRSQNERYGLGFMQEAVEEFNDRFGRKYDVEAVLDSRYDINS